MNKDFTKVTNGTEIFNVYYSGGLWIRENSNEYYDEEDWQNNVITAVKEFEPLKPGYLYIHKKKSTGKVDMVVSTVNAIYLLQQNVLFGDDFVVQVL